MKTKIIPENPEVKEIDWNKKMIVKSGLGVILMTTGEHEEDRFRAYVLHPEKENYAPLMYSSFWYKPAFTPITEPITIKFKP